MSCDELRQLSADWHEIFGTDIPLRMLNGPREEIRNAIEFGRKKLQPVTQTSGSDDSMTEWDSHKQH